MNILGQLEASLNVQDASAARIIRKIRQANDIESAVAELNPSSTELIASTEENLALSIDPTNETRGNTTLSDLLDINLTEPSSNNAQIDPIDSNSIESNALDSNSIEPNSIESTSAESNAVESNAAESNSAESNTAESKAAESNSSELSSSESNSSESSSEEPISTLKISPKTSELATSVASQENSEQSSQEPDMTPPETPTEDLRDLNTIETNKIPTTTLVSIDPAKINNMVTLNLYRNEDPLSPFILNANTLQNAPIDNTRPTKILIHGWLQSGQSLWILRMKDKHFLDSKYNVIIVSWDHAKWEYMLAAGKVKKVGTYVAKLLIQLVQIGKVNVNDLHIVGHCLGAHVAGFIGKSISKLYPEKINRITGLDPARSLYEFPMMARMKKRLSRGDAKLVDVIHTCAGRLGFKRAIGDIDFYPNNGKSAQPGCGTTDRCKYFKRDWNSSTRFKKGVRGL